MKKDQLRQGIGGRWHCLGTRQGNRKSTGRAGIKSGQGPSTETGCPGDDSLALLQS